MKITKLSIFGLKGITEKIIEPKMINIISGRNESGKSSIRDAIIFALYGRVDGSTQTDGAINNQSKHIKVILEFIANDNTSYIIERTKNTKTNTIKLNGRMSNQQAIENLIGIDYQLFSSAFCAGDFMKFEPKERRQILLELVPPKNDRTVLWEKLTGEKECIYDLSNIEASYKVAKNDLDEIDSKIVTTTNKKQFLADEISKLRPIAEAKDEEGTVSTKEFEESQATYNVVVKAEPKLENFISEEAEPVGDLQDSLATAKGELDLAINEKPSKTVVDGLLIEMNNQKDKIEKLKNSAVCITCKRPFDDLTVRTDQLKIENKKLYDIKARGSIENRTYVTANYVWTDRVDILRKKVKGFEKQISDRQDNNSSKIVKGKEQWKEVHVKWEEDCIKANEAFQGIKSKYETSEGIRIQKDNAKNQLTEKEADLEIENTNLKKLDRGVLQNHVNALGAKGISFEEVQGQIEEIQKFLPAECKLQLVEPNKTNDGVKAVFNLTCDGIPYAWLSTGKKLSIDIHLADIITSTLGINMIFVDNIELLTLKIVLKQEPVKQVFTAKVKDEDFSFKSS